MPQTSPPEVKAGTANNNIKLKNNKMEMKANLLKTMLAAVALALPMGAWAAPYTWDFSGSVADGDSYDTNYWVYESSRWYYKTQLTNESLNGSADSYMMRDLLFTTAAAKRVAKNNGVIQLFGSVTLPSLKSGSKVTVYAKANGKNSSNVAFYLTATNLTLNEGCFAGHGENTGYFTEIGTVTSDGAVTITANEGFVNISYITVEDENGVYMSKDQIYAMNNEEYSVGSTKIWTFDALTTGKVYNEVTAVGNEYYLRAAPDPNRTFTVKDVDETTLTFGDGYKVKVNKCLEANGQLVTSQGLAGSSTAAEISKAGHPTFAFNATVAGTLYVKIKYTGNSSSSVRHRILFKTEDGKSVTNQSIEVTDGIDEVSVTRTYACSYFICDLSGSGKFEIYAVRFVPTSEKPKVIVHIGATGYATFGNTTGSHLVIPSGLNVYAAKFTGDAVKLTAVEGIRQGEGYVLGAEPNTDNIELFATDTDPGAANKGGEMTRYAGNADYVNIPSSVVESETTYYQYILGADGTTAKFYEPDGVSTLKAGKAYLKTKTPKNSSAPSFNLIIVDNNVTGINEVKGSGATVNGYYNLNGQRMVQPTKGLYIVNGRKVVLK